MSAQRPRLNEKTAVAPPGVTSLLAIAGCALPRVAGRRHLSAQEGGAGETVENTRDGAFEEWVETASHHLEGEAQDWVLGKRAHADDRIDLAEARRSNRYRDQDRRTTEKPASARPRRRRPS